MGSICDSLRVIEGGVAAPKGFVAAGMACGIKSRKEDLALIYSEVEATASGVFTANRVKAAPLLVNMKNLRRGRARAIIANSGNANAATGEQGIADAKAVGDALAKVLKIKPEEVLLASTGVIGVPLPVGKIISAIPGLVSSLSKGGSREASRAIMTTDTFPKEIALETEIDGAMVRLGGIAKGSGMIHPNMATMLAFFTTDAKITRRMLKRALKGAVDKSFNMITVDGDMSTNDMALILANGLAGNDEISGEGTAFLKFCELLEYASVALAKMIAKDGEGASKFIEVRVKNAPTPRDAKRVAKAIASSNLVKTAIHGEDANWGRILAAVGYSGARFDKDRVDVYIGNVKTAENGMGLPFDEKAAKEALGGQEVMLTVDLKVVDSDACVWTCDLTCDYVKINASYRS